MRRIASLGLLAVMVSTAVAGPSLPHMQPQQRVGEVAPDFESRMRQPPARPAPRRERVKRALVKQRARHLAQFRAYRNRGVFAHDLDRAGEVYVWRDDDGHLDPIAAMMTSDGKQRLVTDYAPSMIGIHLIDLTSGDISDWMLMSGFSIDELDRMQRPHTRPTIVREGDTSWRTDEDARLSTAYAAVESYLRAHAADGLDAATDALMLRSELAWSVVTGKPVPPRPVRPMIPEPRRPPIRHMR